MVDFWVHRITNRNPHLISANDPDIFYLIFWQIILLICCLSRNLKMIVGLDRKVLVKSDIVGKLIILRRRLNVGMSVVLLSWSVICRIDKNHRISCMGIYPTFLILVNLYDPVAWSVCPMVFSKWFSFCWLHVMFERIRLVWNLRSNIFFIKPSLKLVEHILCSKLIFFWGLCFVVGALHWIRKKFFAYFNRTPLAVIRLRFSFDWSSLPIDIVLFFLTVLHFCIVLR